MGAGDADFIGVDAGDRDAAFYEMQGRAAFWDETNQSLPDFEQAFVWAQALAERVGKPVVWWQVPVGNQSLPNEPNRYRDNKLDYFMTHLSEVAASHGAGVLFGAGDGQQTTVESDGGNLIERVNDYASARIAACQ